jgi:RNA polymerase sigma-70 factor (ECF subfamily)
MVTSTLVLQPPGLSSASPVSETDHPSMISPDDEAELLSRIAMQETQAFDTLYACYAPRVRGYLSRGPCPPDLIDEVLQDVMLVLWQHAARVPPGVLLIAWLCGVARHKALKALARVSAPPVSQTMHEGIDHDEPEAVCLHREHVRALTRALATLPLGERTALGLLVYQGCSYQEIATMTGDPVSTVRTRVSRARQRLRTRAATLDSGIASPS